MLLKAVLTFLLARDTVKPGKLCLRILDSLTWLRDYILGRVDAPSLMEFARRLEDAKRMLTSMGPLYVSRLNNEDTILMLMKKLPDEGLKSK